MKDKTKNNSSPSIPANLEMISFLVKEFQRDVKEMGKTLMSLATSITGMEAEITHLREMDSKLWAEVHDNDDRIWKELNIIKEAQLACPIRTNIKSINARLKVLETNDREDLKDRADATGSISVPANAPLVPVEKFSETKYIWKNLKLIIWIVIALMLGASFGGFAVSKMLNTTVPIIEEVRLP